MKRYRFRLDSVLRLRRSEEEAARGALLAARAAVVEQERLVAQRTAAYEQVTSAQGIRRYADFLCEQAHRSAMGAALIAQRTSLREAQELADHAHVAWSAAASKVGALERLDERQRAQHDALARKHEELAVDELVVSRYARSPR